MNRIGALLSLAMVFGPFDPPIDAAVPNAIQWSNPPDAWHCGIPPENLAGLALEGIGTAPIVACRDTGGGTLLLSISDLSDSRNAYSATALARGADEQTPRNWKVQRAYSRFETRRTPAMLDVAHVRLLGLGNGFTLAEKGTTPTLVIWEQVPVVFKNPADDSIGQVILAFELRSPVTVAESKRNAAIRQREEQLASWVDSLSIDRTKLIPLVPSEYEFLKSSTVQPLSPPPAPQQARAPEIAPYSIGQVFLAATAPESDVATLRQLQDAAVMYEGTTVGSIARELARGAQARMAAQQIPEIWRSIVSNVPREQLPSYAALFLQAAFLRDDPSTVRLVMTSASEAGLTLAGFSSSDLEKILDGLRASRFQFSTDTERKVLAIDFDRDEARLTRTLTTLGIVIIPIGEVAREVSSQRNTWRLQRRKGGGSPGILRHNKVLGTLRSEQGMWRFEPFDDLAQLSAALSQDRAGDGTAK